MYFILTSLCSPYLLNYICHFHIIPKLYSLIYTKLKNNIIAIIYLQFHQNISKIKSEINVLCGSEDAYLDSFLCEYENASSDQFMSKYGVSVRNA